MQFNSKLSCEAGSSLKRVEYIKFTSSSSNMKPSVSSNAVMHSAGGSVKYTKSLVKQRAIHEIEVFKKELDIDDHIITLKALEKRYSTDLENGLSKMRATELLLIYGPNCLSPPKVKSRYLIFIEYMFGGFSTLLWIGAILSMVGYIIEYTHDPESPMDQLYLTIVIVIVIMITGLFGFYQESANTSIMESFRKMIPRQATVKRDGEKIIVYSEHLVIGDIVYFEAGDCVPADLRLLGSEGLKVDNSSITGESEPQFRSAEGVDKNPLESPNLMFYGTNIVEGDGFGIVISCGSDTLMGHIAGLAAGLQPGDTLIKKELEHFVNIVTGMAVAIGVIFFIASMAIGKNFFDAFVFCIAIVVANVPEGLLVTMTACMTLTARKMSKKNCLVKNLQAIETLGSTTVICSDKTGTLTQNRMTTSHLFFDKNIHDILTGPEFDREDHHFKALARVGILCNRATFLSGQENIPISERKVHGDASENGILKAMEMIVGDVDVYRSKYPKLFEVPFNSTNKYQLSIHSLNDKYLLVMKGAPEKIMDRCTTIFNNDNDEEMTPENQLAVKNGISHLGYLGERVLGFADLIMDKNSFPSGFKFENVNNVTNFQSDNLRFVGLMSLIDPPRPGVVEAVSKCKSAGIRIAMVTGDHPLTAVAIARKVGIISPNNDTVYDLAMTRNISMSKVDRLQTEGSRAAVVTGSEMREMDSIVLDMITYGYEELVFARTSPQQKLLIVESYQRNKDIIAVTGDGVNDSPALKKSDIGIAMGISGSEVSKEAADMIILDDNFASIVIGIEEGRLIFDNLKKSIAYMLTSNVPEIMPFIFLIFLGIPNALSIMAILIIDVGTDIWPGISLAYEGAEADIMKRKPRNLKKDQLVNSRLICFTYLNVGIIQTCAGYSSYFTVMAMHGFMPIDLIGVQSKWNKMSQNDLLDSFGHEWTYRERKILEQKCCSAYFLALVLTQIADVFICKTRRLSIFQKGCENWVMNFGVMFEIAIACFVVFCPGLNNVLQFEVVNPICILPAIPFAIIIIVFDETRRFLMRKTPGGWIEIETYF